MATTLRRQATASPTPSSAVDVGADTGSVLPAGSVSASAGNIGAIGCDGILQRLHAGVSERRRGAIEPAILARERRDAFAETVCGSGRARKPKSDHDLAVAGA